MSSAKKCCVPHCNSEKEILHKFPNPILHPERFQAWVHNIGGDILALDNSGIFRKRRVCHLHFNPHDHTRSKFLSPNAVPVLHLTKQHLDEISYQDNTDASPAAVSPFQELSNPLEPTLVKDEEVSETPTTSRERKMLPWNCCRTCLSQQNLNPIFSLVGQNEKYIIAVFLAFGIKIEPNDNLPQQMCSDCVNFVNESDKFRKQAEETQKELLRRLQNAQCSETQPLAINLCNNVDLNDDDDDVTLDNFQYSCTAEKLDENSCTKTQVEFGCKEQDLVDTPAQIVLGTKKKKNASKGKTVKRKPRKKEPEQRETEANIDKDKKERVREEIECEYCHKILTSRLSMRNHYKIHTGFDVVCEHCGKKFITRRLLLMHCRAKHGYEKTDKCSYCDYRASNAEQVKIHERLHTGEKPYVCQECGAGFHRKSSYLQHVAIHLPDKTVQCSHCPARFKSVTLMRIHAHRHRAAQYAFRCGVCGNSFARRRNVARHLQRVHALPPDAHRIHRLTVK